MKKSTPLQRKGDIFIECNLMLEPIISHTPLGTKEYKTKLEPDDKDLNALFYAIKALIINLRGAVDNLFNNLAVLYGCY